MAANVNGKTLLLVKAECAITSIWRTNAARLAYQLHAQTFTIGRRILLPTLTSK
jgi:hypothetical protein